MSTNLGHFAASNWDFFGSSSSLSFSTWRVQSAPTPSEIDLNNGSTAPLATSSHALRVRGNRPDRGVANLLDALSRRLEAGSNRPQVIGIAAFDKGRRQPGDDPVHLPLGHAI